MSANRLGLNRGRDDHFWRSEWWGWNGRISLAFCSYMISLLPFIAYAADFHGRPYLHALALPLTIVFYFFQHNPPVSVISPVGVIKIAVYAATVIGTVVIAKLV